MNYRRELNELIRRRGVNHCAALIGVSHSALSQWLSGSSAISDEGIGALIVSLQGETERDLDVLDDVRDHWRTTRLE